MKRNILTCTFLLPTCFATAAEPLSHVPFETIQVTAQKRVQNVQDVSVSVSAMSGETLHELGITTTHEIATQLPGITISDISGTPNNLLISIRGASQNDFGDHNESSSAVYIDEAYISAIGGVGLQLFDLQRVEVLRGPQGTLFGRNSTGGLVHFISNQPLSKNYAEFEYGSFNRQRFEGAVGIGDQRLSGRISAQLLTQDGYIKNRIGPDMLAYDRAAYRAQLLFNPDDQWSFWLKASYNKTDDHPGAAYEHRASIIDVNDHNRSSYFDPSLNPYDTCNGCDMFGYRDSDGDIWTSDINMTDAKTDRDMNQYTAKINWIGEQLSITAISDLQTIEKTYEEDCDASPSDICGFGSYQDSRQWSQELRMAGEQGKLQWLVGANYLNIDGDYEIHLWVNDFGYFPSSSYRLKTESLSVFGQLEYDLGDSWLLTLGSRWTDDSREFNYINRILPGPDRNLASDAYLLSFSQDLMVDRLTSESECSAMGGTFSSDGVGNLCNKTGLIDPNTGEAEWSFRLALDHHLNDDTMVYASFTRGTKGGGYSAPFEANLRVEQIPYGSEIIHNYETGFKANLLNGKAFASGAIFYADYQDYQAFDFQGLTQVIDNRDAFLKGAELELRLQLEQGWSMSFGASLLEAKVKNMVLPDGTLADTHLPQAPAYTFNALLHKIWSLDQGAKITAQFDVNFSAKQYFSIANHQSTSMDSYSVGNLKVSYIDSADQWQLSLWIKNLWQTEYANYGFDATTAFGYSFLSYAPPRTAGLTLSYRFAE